MLLFGQGLIALFSGNRRQENPIYRMFVFLTKPITVAVRWLTPKFVVDQHIPLVAFLLLGWVWIGAVVAKVSLCVDQPEVAVCARRAE